MSSLRNPSTFLSRPFRVLKQRSSPRRTFTTPPPSSQPTPTPPPPSPGSATQKKDVRSRLRRFNDRLPPFLRGYTTPLLSAPGTHITSFLILHEITAIVPLFGLVAAFHYGNWLPDLTSYSGFEEGTRRFGRWLRKKGWVEEEESGAESGAGTTETERKGVRLVLEFATAYAVTKALLPLRIVGSVWATPWFARVLLAPVGRGVARLFGKK